MEVDAIVNTLVIEIDHAKYKKFLHNNNFFSPSKTCSFRLAIRVEVRSTSTHGFTLPIKVNQYNNTSVAVIATSTVVNVAQVSSSSSILFIASRTNPLQ